MESLRNHRTPYIKSVRSLTVQDLPKLREPANKPYILTLRDAHWNVIRLLALGLPHGEIGRRTGYSLARICQLSADPTVRDQVFKLQAAGNAAVVEQIDEFAEMATANMKKAERKLSEKLDDDDAAISIRELVAITSDRADRFGYGKRQTNLNVNVDFAARLEAAIQRTNRIIDAQREDK